MNTAAIIAELEAKRDRLDTAIAALRGSRYGEPRGKASRNARKGRKMSAAARRRIGEAKRKWWAERKKK